MTPLQEMTLAIWTLGGAGLAAYLIQDPRLWDQHCSWRQVAILILLALPALLIAGPIAGMLLLLVWGAERGAERLRRSFRSISKKRGD